MVAIIVNLSMGKAIVVLWVEKEQVAWPHGNGNTELWKHKMIYHFQVGIVPTRFIMYCLLVPSFIVPSTPISSNISSLFYNSSL
jgi:hypothetical protein